MNSSVAVKLAWQVACAETVRARKELIDPEQFLRRPGSSTFLCGARISQRINYFCYRTLLA
jgi:hypothetical protein